MSDINWDDLARENLLDTLKKHKRDIAQKDRDIAELVEALGCYVKEVPLGHQPHMMAHKAEALIAKHKKG